MYHFRTFLIAGIILIGLAFQQQLSGDFSSGGIILGIVGAVFLIVAIVKKQHEDTKDS